MSSDGLVRATYRPRYRAILRANLPPDFQGFETFFANEYRLGTLGRLLARHLPPGQGAVLNLGSGPFASEIFVGALQGRPVFAVDYERAFAPFYRLFRREGVLPQVTFALGNVETIAFAPGRFAALLMHDLLYESALDLDRLLARHAAALAPGGLLYCDVMSTRTRRLWTLLGRERGYHRYGKDEMQAILARHGFTIVDCVPSIGSPSRLVRAGERVLWRLTGLSNATAVVGRRDGARP